MRNIFVFVFVAVLAFAPVAVLSQTTGFVVLNGSLAWRKVYTSDMDFKSLYFAVVSSGKFTDVDTINNTVVGRFSGFDADYVGAGYSLLIVPIYVSSYPVGAAFTINYKPGKYRVTLTGIEIGEDKEREKLDVYALRGEGLKHAFAKSPARIYEYTFNQAFSFTVAVDNW